MKVPTPHIECKNKDEIAKVVLMPGDPLRAKFVADTFLEDVVQFNAVRNMFGYTGTYNGKRVSVMGSGMGMPSIGIYSYELFKFYDVESIIRIGSCGAYSEDLKVYDVILCEDAWTESTYAKVSCGYDSNVINPSETLNNKLISSANRLGIKMHEARIHSSDVFYRESDSDKTVRFSQIRDKEGCLAVEMESFALFANANVTGKHASCILTVSDSLVNRQATTSEERQTAFTQMIKIALESIE